MKCRVKGGEVRKREVRNREVTGAVLSTDPAPSARAPVGGDKARCPFRLKTVPARGGPARHYQA